MLIGVTDRILVTVQKSAAQTARMMFRTGQPQNSSCIIALEIDASYKTGTIPAIKEKIRERHDTCCYP